ncbi:MAG: hypoxanthine phosphoribosyltransferase, partial [Selenomonas sp.]|nr:hypoxanthine phosphoribosyltransferase [Selenomonas sp.]
MLHEDIEKVVFTEEQIQTRIAELAKEITNDYKDAKEDIYCVGILKGAVMFYTDLLRKLELPVRMDFMIASSYGNGTSTTGSVKILKDLDYDIEGKH